MPRAEVWGSGRRVKVPREQISGLIAFWNLGDLWTQINLHSRSKSHKGFSAAYYGLSRAGWVKGLRSPVNPAPYGQIFIAWYTSMVPCKSGLCLSIC